MQQDTNLTSFTVFRNRSCAYSKSSPMSLLWFI